MASNKKWLKIGQILTKKELDKDGNPQFYLKISANKGKDGNKSFEEIVLQDGQMLQLQKPSDEIQSLFDRGFIDEDEMEARIAKIPEFVKFNVILPPLKD